jgi:hypothetical protein
MLVDLLRLHIFLEYFFYCGSFLDVVNGLHFISFVREILVHMVFFASPTLNWWYSCFSQGVFFLGFLLSRLILLICIWNILIERRFESLPSLIRILLLLILPRLLQIFFVLSLLIQVRIFPNGFCQSYRLIILNIFLIK